MFTKHLYFQSIFTPSGSTKSTPIIVSILWKGKLILGIGWDRWEASPCTLGDPSTLTWVCWFAVLNMSPNMGPRKTPPSYTTWVLAEGFTPVRFTSETWNGYISGELSWNRTLILIKANNKGSFHILCKIIW